MKYIKRFAAIIVSVALGISPLVSVPVLAIPPSGGSVTIGPEPAYTDTDLTATLDGWDETGAVPAITYSYQWQYWDGDSWEDIVGATEATLASTDFSKVKGDQIKVICTPADQSGEGGATVEGTPAEDTITISNKPPEGGIVTIEPAAPGPFYTDIDLIATPSGWTDADGDEIFYEYHWEYWDGDSWEDIAGAPNTDTLPSSFFGYGDQIRVWCTPYDVTDDINDYGEPAVSNEVDIVSYPISIDVKPGSSVNPINLGSKGVIPVAIITTEDFDAATVDASTVRFGPGEAQAVHSAIEDVDDDGDLDMILHFRTQDTGILGTDTEVVLTGETIAGETDARHFTGTDLIKIVPSKVKEAVQGNESAPGQNKEPGESAEGKGKEAAPGQNKEPGESAEGKGKGKNK